MFRHFLRIRLQEPVEPFTPEVFQINATDEEIEAALSLHKYAEPYPSLNTSEVGVWQIRDIILALRS
jgi:hypothetical protein